MVTVEGEAEFWIPSVGKSCMTWYKVFGNLAARTHRPLVAIHDGPGLTHDYLLALTDLTFAYDIPLILYDQIGNGSSTHLPDKRDDSSFWTVDLFLDELDNLLVHLDISDDYALLGHSWGAIIAASHAVRQPPGLKLLVLESPVPDTDIWLQAQWDIRNSLPQTVQDVLEKHESAETSFTLEYQIAMNYFVSRNVCRLNPPPEEFSASYAWFFRSDMIRAMYGPSQWSITGSLKGWSILDELQNINVPTLLVNGRYDQSQDSCIAPFFKAVEKVKWVTFENSSHIAHLEERERFMEIAAEFLLYCY